MNVLELTKEKSRVLLELEEAKLHRTKRTIFQLASKAASLESTIAYRLLLDNRREDAVINLVSAASCLMDSNRRPEAKRILARAGIITNVSRTSSWIERELSHLRDALVPAEIFGKADPFIVNNSQLRIPQIGAYVAAKQHFANTRDHAIIQLPVGCGKTGTMSILPFGISNGRTLAVAPNLEIARTLKRSFDYSSEESFLKKTGVLKNGQGPTCAFLDSDANILDCDNSDYVVTNIQQLVASQSKKWLAQFPVDYFDLILVDEGHHNVAPSWQESLGCFPEAKVVSFTATPLRSDGKLVEGTRIYRFPITDAIRQGYVRDIESRRLEPGEIYFEYKGSKHRHSIEEVMALREETWFSKGIALAPECNRHIVDASIQCMTELRAVRKTKHQIIAAACSIDHAKAVRSLYNERSCRAEVIHSNMDEADQNKVRGALSRGELDAIVQVQMLGEGADYPNLGVAAIFRPYRHLVPYIQFVGRIMRVVKQNSPGDPDNRGFVVSHAGLNVDRWWKELRSFDADDQAFFESIAKGEMAFHYPTDNTATLEEEPRRAFRPEMRVLEEVIDHFVKERFLEEDSKALVDDLIKAMELRGVSIETLGISRAELESRLLEQQKRVPKKGRISETQVQPQVARQEARKRLDERVRSAAKQLLNELKLKIVGIDLARSYPQYAATNNLAAAIILINIEVNEYLDAGSKVRDLLSIDELRKAHDNMDEIVDRVATRVRSRVKK